MTIAVCEDDKSQAQQMSQYIGRHPGGHSHKVFHSAERLLSAYSSGERFDLIFMDIQMGGKDGLAASKELNMEYPGEFPLIVFITISRDYAPYGYGTAWRFIVKPADMETIHYHINLAADELAGRFISLDTTSGMAVIDKKGIIYLAANYGTVTIFTAKGEYETKLTLSALSPQLPRWLIVPVHRSYYVNLAHVASYGGNVITMCNEVKVPIGRGKKQEFKAAHETYLRGERFGKL